MMNIQLRSNNGQPCLLINSKKFILTNGFSIHLALEELRSLNTGLKIEFESFTQFNELITDVNEIVNNTKVLHLISTENLLCELVRRNRNGKFKTQT